MAVWRDRRGAGPCGPTRLYNPRVAEYEFSEHAADMLKERNIRDAWVKLAMAEPERKEEKGDGTVHYLRAIEEHGGRYLRLVVDPASRPLRIITLFFDRRLGRQP